MRVVLFLQFGNMLFNISAADLVRTFKRRLVLVLISHRARLHTPTHYTLMNPHIYLQTEYLEHKTLREQQETNSWVRKLTSHPNQLST